MHALLKRVSKMFTGEALDPNQGRLLTSVSQILFIDLSNRLANHSPPPETDERAPSNPGFRLTLLPLASHYSYTLIPIDFNTYHPFALSLYPPFFYTSLFSV